jgi:DNA-binding transcriptional regulator GbsR (MarR family)
MGKTKRPASSPSDPTRSSPLSNGCRDSTLRLFKFSQFRLIAWGAQLRFQIVLKALTECEAALPAEIAVADTIGRLMQFWGFKRPMGRLWTLLYLSPNPLSASTIGEMLQMSTGSVSMALSELEKWGAVTRTWIPGHRRDFFAAESDIWKLVQRVMRERELSLVRDFGSSLNQAENELSSLQPEANEDLAKALIYKRDRLHRLTKLSQAGEILLKALVAGDAIDPTLLVKTPD